MSFITVEVWYHEEYHRKTRVSHHVGESLEAVIRRIAQLENQNFRLAHLYTRYDDPDVRIDLLLEPRRDRVFLELYERYGSLGTQKYGVAYLEARFEVDEPAAAAVAPEPKVRLLIEHVDYTYLVAYGMIMEEPGAMVEAHTQRLLRNQEELGALFGPDVSRPVQRALKEHIVQGAGIIQAVIDERDTDELVIRWRQNGDTCAQLMGVERAAFQMHLDQTLAYVGAIKRGDWRAAIEGVDAARRHMSEML